MMRPQTTGVAIVSVSDTLDSFLARVADRGGYGCAQQAARAVQHVLEVLGAHLVGDDRTDLARLLPHHWPARC